MNQFNENQPNSQKSSETTSKNRISDKKPEPIISPLEDDRTAILSRREFLIALTMVSTVGVLTSSCAGPRENSTQNTNFSDNTVYKSGSPPATKIRRQTLPQYPTPEPGPSLSDILNSSKSFVEHMRITYKQYRTKRDGPESTENYKYCIDGVLSQMVPLVELAEKEFVELKKAAAKNQLPYAKNHFVKLEQAFTKFSDLSIEANYCDSEIDFNNSQICLSESEICLSFVDPMVCLEFVDPQVCLWFVD